MKIEIGAVEYSYQNLTSFTLSHNVHPSFVNSLTVGAPSVSYIEPVTLADNADATSREGLDCKWMLRRCITIADVLCCL